MDWFRRKPDAEPVATPAPEADGDSPAELRRGLAELVRLINRSSGRLPAEAVVEARRITDTLRTIVDTSEVRPLDVYAALTVRSTVDDYLPTTLRSYLAADANLIDVPRPAGGTPTEALLEQLAALHTAVTTVLTAAREQDADALMTQGNFLRTKFSGSDLEL